MESCKPDWPQLYEYGRRPEIPEHIGNLARTLASGGMYKEAEQVLEMHEIYERSMNYYKLIASTVQHYSNEDTNMV
jgi:hypothetical protein